MLDMELSLAKNGRRQNVTCRLDFASQQWSMRQPSGLWSEVVFSGKGKFEVRDNGVIWIWDGPAGRANAYNTLIIKNAPTSPSDLKHQSGVARLYAPKEKSLKDQHASWKVTRRSAPPPARSNSPIRQRIMAVCDEKVPKGIPYNYFAGEPKNDGAGVTNCNIFVGLILSYIHPDRRKMFKRIAGELFAAPRFEWYLYAEKIDRERSPAKSTWVPYAAGSLPKPGDIYQLEVIKDKGRLKKGMTQHIGIVEEATSTIWKTIDGGQKAEANRPSYACKRVERKCKAGISDGEFGEQAKIKGWVDVDRLIAVVPEVFPKELIPK